MAKKYKKLDLLEVLRAINVAFHLGFLTNEEKNILLDAIVTKNLSEQVSIMLKQKTQYYPDQEDFAVIMTYFKKGESHVNERICTG